MSLELAPGIIKVPCYNQTTGNKCNGTLKLMFADMKNTKFCKHCRDVNNPSTKTFRSKTWNKRDRPLQIKLYNLAWERAREMSEM